jgi:predicted DNA-binding protein (MmcQ/YjbR family)
MHDEQLRSVLAGWPGVSCDLKWDHDRTWSVGGKLFAVLALDGPKRGQLSFKVDNSRFLELTDLPGVHPAPYLARAHWISLAPGHPLSAAEVEALLRQSYRLVRAKLPKRVREALPELAE